MTLTPSPKKMEEGTEASELKRQKHGQAQNYSAFGKRKEVT